MPTFAARIRRQLLALALLTLGATAASAFGSNPVGDSGGQHPEYSEILRRLHNLELAYPGWARTVDYGLSAQNRPLRLVEVQDPTRQGVLRKGARRPAVLISGATHGNEYLNIEDRLPAWILAHHDGSPGIARFLRAGGVVIVVPIVNPDGYVHNTRENSRGQDLNRDFDLLPAAEPRFHESETRQLAAWLDRELVDAKLNLKLTVDYHCCNGSLLNPWSYTEAPLPALDQPAFALIGQMMQQDIDSTYAIGDTGQVLGYLARGTSKDFYYARYHALAFTFEGKYGMEAQKFMNHVTWWDHVLGRIAG